MAENVGSTGDYYDNNTDSDGNVYDQGSVQKGMNKGATKDSAYQSIIDETNADGNLIKVMHANGIYDRSDFNDWGTFYRFQRMDPYRLAPNSKEYIFITKPDLHIFEGSADTLNPEIAGNAFFVDLMTRGYGTVLKNLQYSVDTSCPFIRAFTNLKRSNVDLTAITAGDQDTASNMFNTKMTYRKSSFSSDEDADFNIEFEDSKYLEVYLWFRAFDEYERKKFEGRVTPPSQSYTFNKILHDQMTLFKFIVGENGEDIIHYSRITGCYPKNVNRDAFGDMPDDGHIKLTTSWKGTFVKDMDPEIIAHFNKLVSANGVSGTGYVDVWDDSIQAISGEDVTMPYISVDYVPNSDYLQYRLKWRGYTDTSTTTTDTTSG